MAKCQDAEMPFLKGIADMYLKDDGKMDRVLMHILGRCFVCAEINKHKKIKLKIWEVRAC